jgi:SecD/SecF fusion protein
MQGKGFVRFFAIVLAVVFLAQFLLTFPTSRLESEAHNYATGVANGNDAAYKVAKAAYLDSFSSKKLVKIPLLKSYTYQDLKSQQLALGLDLKGGMSVVLQVDLQDFVKNLGKKSTDAAFNTALTKASDRLKTGGSDFVSLFVDEYKKAGGQSLAAIFSRSEIFSNRIKFDTPEDVVVNVVRDAAKEAVKTTYDRLKERIDAFGVTQPNVSLDAARDLIVVELPGVENPKRAIAMITEQAALEFWDVYRVIDPGLTQSFQMADAKAKMIMANDTSKQIKLDSSNMGPILSNMTLNSNGQLGLAVMGSAEKEKMNVINSFLKKPEIAQLFPRDLTFAWSQKPEKDATGKEGTIYNLYALRGKRGAEGPSLTGDCVTDAFANPDPTTGQVAVSLKMNTDGAKKWDDLTNRAAKDNNREVAVVLDGKVVSAPRVNDRISTGDSQITGSYTVEEGQDFARILKIGRLPAQTQVIQQSVVGPSLGQENINKSLISLGIGLLAIIVLMSTYYSTAGIISIVALLINIFFIIGTLTSYGTVLTLPGIAGIVLTMASAVDANVIIYERCREELAEGKSVAQAIKDGFLNSYSAIFDANISNLLIAFVMAYFGLGPIKGFAVVLIIGILSTLFTAVFLCHLLMEYWFGKGKVIEFSKPWSANIFTGIKYDWVGKRKIAYAVSALFILAGVASYFTRGFELGVDFKGGFSYNVQFSQKVDDQALRASLDSKFGGTTIVKAIDITNTFNIVTAYGIDDASPEASDKVMDKLFEGIQTVDASAKIEDFKKQDSAGKTHVTSYSKVGSYVADDIRGSAFKATALSLLLIFIYVTFRFSKWQFSAGAVIALFHDVLLVMSFFTLFHGILPFSMEIDQAFVAAILTVIGYSMNDTIVVYDRIREYIHKYTGMSKAEVINDAINNTLSRTIMTSFITFLSMFILFAFGGSSVRGFAFALLIGIIVGTYSSIFVATPIMVDLTDEHLTDAPKPVEAKKKEAVKA